MDSISVTDEALSRRAAGVDLPTARRRALELCCIDDVPVEQALYTLGCGDPLAHCDQPGDVDLLDVGCGAGVDLARAAAHPGGRGRRIGIDPSLAALDLAARFSDATLVLGRGESLPLADGRVDVVVLNGLLAVAGDRRAVCAEARRALRDGGQLLLCELVAAGLPAPLWRASRGLRLAGVDPDLDEPAVVDLLAGAGFRDVEVPKRRVLDEALLAVVLAGGAVDVAGCSASGAVASLEVAAALQGQVGVIEIVAQR